MVVVVVVRIDGIGWVACQTGGIDRSVGKQTIRRCKIVHPIPSRCCSINRRGCVSDLRELMFLCGARDYRPFVRSSLSDRFSKCKTRCALSVLQSREGGKGNADDDGRGVNPSPKCFRYGQTTSRRPLPIVTIIIVPYWASYVASHFGDGDWDSRESESGR